MRELLKDNKYKFWTALLVISFVGIILMFFTTYYDLNYDRTHWKEFFILYLYFTFMSNVFALVTSAIVVINKVNPESKHLQRLKVMMAVNLTVTMIIFWAVIAKNLGDYTPLGLVGTLFVHAITPTLALTTFFYEGYKTKMASDKQISAKKTMIINITFPALWFIMAVSLYVGLNIHEDWNGPKGTGDNAIYGFLDFADGWLMPTIVLPTIAIMYPGLTYLYTRIYNRQAK